jgi:hypothetical protein
MSAYCLKRCMVWACILFGLLQGSSAICAGNDCTDLDSVLLGVESSTHEASHIMMKDRNLRGGVAANALSQDGALERDDEPRQLGETSEKFKEGLSGAGRIIIPIITSSIFIIIVFLLIICKVMNRFC